MKARILKRMIPIVMAATLVLNGIVGVYAEESSNEVTELSEMEVATETEDGQEVEESSISESEDIVSDEEVGNDTTEDTLGTEDILETEDEANVESETAGDIPSSDELEEGEVLTEDIEIGGETIPAGATKWRGHYYYLYTDKMTMSEASATCKSMGGYLATLTSEGERTLVGNLIDNLSLESDRRAGYTIGGKKGDYDTVAKFSEIEGYWDTTGERDTANFSVKHTYSDDYSSYHDQMADSYRVLRYEQPYINNPLNRKGGYWWTEYKRDSEEKFGYICEWGEITDVLFDDVKCELSTMNVVYNGNRTVTPTITLKYDGVTLEQGFDYKYEITGNMNPGIAQIKIEGRGAFSGEKKVYYAVEPKLTVKTEVNEDRLTVRVSTEQIPVSDDNNYLKNFMNGLTMPLSAEDQENVTNLMITGAENEEESITYFIMNTMAKKTMTINVQTPGGRIYTVNNVRVNAGIDADIYQANYILDDASFLKGLEADIDNISPGRALVESGKKYKLPMATAIWKTLSTVGDVADDGSNAIGSVTKQKDLYEAILIDALEESCTQSMLLDIKDFSNGANSLVETVKVVNESVQTLDTESFYLANIPDITDVFNPKTPAFKDLEMLMDPSNDVFAYDLAACSTVKDVVQKASKILWKDSVKLDDAWFDKKVSGFNDKLDGTVLVVNSLQKAVDYSIACYALQSLSDETQTVLSQMRKNAAGNAELQLAISDVNFMLDHAILAASARLDRIAGEAAATVMIKSVWKDVRVSAGPYVNMMIVAYKAGKIVSNALGNTDKVTESYAKVQATVEIEDILRKVYYSNKSSYLNNRTSENASLYNQSLQLMYYLLSVDCKYSIDFCNQVNGGALGGWLGAIDNALGTSDASEAKKKIESIKSSIKGQLISIRTAWLYAMEGDYPAAFKRNKYDELLGKLETAYYKVQCPVNVEVVGPGNVVVASMIDHQVDWNGTTDVVIAAIDDGADIWFFDQADRYTLRYIGTDSGTMDIAIEKYDSDGNVSQTIDFYNVPLTQGSTYTSEEDLTQDTNEYNLEDQNDKWADLIVPNVDSADTSKTAYTVKIENGFAICNLEDGPSATMECYPDQKITIYSLLGDAFSNWVASSAVVLEDANASTTTFKMPKENVIIKANKITKQINSNSVTLSFTSAKYTGKEIKPAVVVKDGATTLTVEKDYNVKYENNVNVGKAKVTVTGVGDYSGTVVKEFTITPLETSLSFAATNVSKTFGDAAFVNQIIVNTTSTVAFASSDSSVATVDSTGKVTIKGVGTATIKATVAKTANRAGAEASYQLVVAKATQTLKVTTSAKSVKAKALKKKNQTTTKVAVKVLDNAKITYQKAKGSSAKLSINKKTGKITVKKGSKKGTYKIKVKVTVAATANYTAASKTVTIKVKVK